MIGIRPILAHEYAKALALDVTESGSMLYRSVDGRLVEEERAWQRPTHGSWSWSLRIFT